MRAGGGSAVSFLWASCVASIVQSVRSSSVVPDAGCRLAAVAVPAKTVTGAPSTTDQAGADAYKPAAASPAATSRDLLVRGVLMSRSLAPDARAELSLNISSTGIRQPLESRRLVMSGSRYR